MRFIYGQKNGKKVAALLVLFLSIEEYFMGYLQMNKNIF